MYVINKAQSFKDQLKLVDGNREILLDINLEINTSLIPKYRNLQIKLAELSKQSEESQNQVYVEELGQCIVEMMCLLLGQSNTEKILSFYNGNNEEMLCDIFPYIQGVIVPEIEKLAKERKKQFTRKSWR